MVHKNKDDEREKRIDMEIIADAYDTEERALGWHAYLSQMLNFPFTARCITKRITSPLKLEDKVKVVRMAPEEECDYEMFVLILRKSDSLAVPLIQLEGVDIDEETQQAIEDWHYWVKQGYTL